jgi:hypothetical protein
MVLPQNVILSVWYFRRMSFYQYGTSAECHSISMILPQNVILSVWYLRRMSFYQYGTCAECHNISMVLPQNVILSVWYFRRMSFYQYGTYTECHSISSAECRCSIVSSLFQFNIAIPSYNVPRWICLPVLTFCPEFHVSLDAV